MEALIKKVLSDEESRKKQQQQIDKIEKNVRVIGNLICDESGECRLATKEDLGRVAEKRGAKGDLSQLTNKDLYTQLIKSQTAVEDLKGVHLEKLKEDPEYLKKALEDKELVGKMVSILCDDEGCRLVFNEEIDKAHKEGRTKGQKESWLTKKGG